MLQIEVALLSGNPELLTLPPSSTVQDVMTKAQRAFGKKYLKLITAKNRTSSRFGSKPWEKRRYRTESTLQL